MITLLLVAFGFAAAQAEQNVVAQPAVVWVPNNGVATFRSTNYPGTYPKNHTESWVVVGPPGSVLQFDTTSFALEFLCLNDYLELTENGQSLGKFCGREGPYDLRTSSNQALVVFKTDDTVEYAGFEITVRAQRCLRGMDSCPNHNDVCIARDSWCNGVRECPDGADELCAKGTCGVPMVQPALTWEQRIVGGIEAVPHSWPWQISDRWILTAGHCCTSERPDKIRARLGVHKLDYQFDAGYNVAIDKIVRHPGFQYIQPGTAKENDFCLIRTKEPMAFGRFVSPVCLPSSSETDLEDAGKECYITGWGHRENGAPTTVLRQTHVRIANQTLCNDAYKGLINSQMICASEGDRSACDNDDGGPLVCKTSGGQFKLVGVMSWAWGCGLPNNPSVFGRTSSALDWINQTMSSKMD